MGDGLKSVFDQSRKLPVEKTLDQLRHNYLTKAQLDDSDDTSIGGLNINNGKQRESVKAEKKKRKQAMDSVLINALLDDMRRRLQDLEDSMTEQYERLSQKYGENVIGGMAETFLTDEERAGLETDEDKLNALANKFLDDNGEIKEQYKDLEEAKYVRDWNEARQLKSVVVKYEGRGDLTVEEQQEVYVTAKAVGLPGQESMHLQSDNAEFKEIVEETMEEDRAGQETVKPDSTLTFR